MFSHNCVVTQNYIIAKNNLMLTGFERFWSRFVGSLVLLRSENRIYRKHLQVLFSDKLYVFQVLMSRVFIKVLKCLNYWSRFVVCLALLLCKKRVYRKPLSEVSRSGMRCVHTDKYYRNLTQSNPNQSVFTVYWLIWNSKRTVSVCFSKPIGAW